MVQPMVNGSQRLKALKARIERHTGPFYMWLALAAAIFLMVEAGLRLAGEKTYPVSESLWLMEVAVAGWAIQAYRGPFSRLLADFVQLTRLHRSSDAGPGDNDADSVARYVACSTDAAFSLWSPLPMALIVGVGLGWAATLWSLGSPFNRSLTGWLSYLFFIPMVVTGMWGSACVVRVLRAFQDAASHGLDTYFSSSKNPTLVAMEQRWSSYGVVIALVYFLVLGALWLGPFALSMMPLPIWLSVLATIPLLWWLAGGFQLHTYLAEIKRANLAKAAARVTQLSNALRDDSSGDELMSLSIALDIEARVNEMDEWPAGFDVRGFLVAATPIAAQTLVVLAGWDIVS